MSKKGILSLSKTAGIRKRAFILPLYIDPNEARKRLNLPQDSPGLKWMLEEIYPPPGSEKSLIAYEPMYRTRIRANTPLYESLSRAYQRSQQTRLPISYSIPEPASLLGRQITGDVNMMLSQGLLIRELEKAGVPVVALARDMAVPVYIARAFGTNPLYLPLSRNVLPAAAISNPEFYHLDVPTMMLYAMWKKAREGGELNPTLESIWREVLGEGGFANIEGRRVPIPVVMDTGMAGTIPLHMGLVSDKHFPTILMFTGPRDPELVKHQMGLYDLIRHETSPREYIPKEQMEKITDRLIDPIEHRTHHPPIMGYGMGVEPVDPDFLPAFTHRPGQYLTSFEHFRALQRPFLHEEGVRELARVLEPIVGEEAREISYPVATRPEQYLGATEDEMREFARWMREKLGLPPNEPISGKGNQVKDMLGWAEEAWYDPALEHAGEGVYTTRARGSKILKNLARTEEFAVPWVELEGRPWIGKRVGGTMLNLLKKLWRML